MTMFQTRNVIVAALTVLCTLGAVWAPAVRAQEEKDDKLLTVAVLNFETKGKNVADLGEKIADLLTVFLSQEEQMQLVERAKIKKILEELKLSATGIVDPNNAVRIGGLLGAQVLITGRAFVVNEKLYLTAKAISVETSRVNAQLSKGELDADLDVIVQDVSGKLAKWLGENADKMVAKIQTPKDQVSALRKAIGKQALPTVAAAVFERHVGQATIDPAAETELIYLARKVGVPVVSGKKLRISDWAREYIKDAGLPIPDAAKKADVLIVGEGFSEFAGRVGDLISVKARVEIKAVDTKTGKVLAINRKTVTHVDLAEQIAGKTALRKAAGQAAVELLPEVVGEWSKLRQAKPAEE